MLRAQDTVLASGTRERLARSNLKSECRPRRGGQFTGSVHGNAQCKTGDGEYNTHSYLNVCLYTALANMGRTRFRGINGLFRVRSYSPLVSTCVHLGE